MMKATSESAESKTEIPTAVVETSGESLADGSAIELVASPTGNQPGLLLWADDRPTFAAYILRDGKVYVPSNVDPTIWAATTLPTGVENRDPSANLFSETRQLVTTYVGTSADEAALVTAWSVTTWFVDVLPSPPTLFIHGGDMN